jgi:hypothetical protein
MNQASWKMPLWEEFTIVLGIVAGSVSLCILATWTCRKCHRDHQTRTRGVKITTPSRESFATTPHNSRPQTIPSIDIPRAEPSLDRSTTQGAHVPGFRAQPLPYSEDRQHDISTLDLESIESGAYTTRIGVFNVADEDESNHKNWEVRSTHKSGPCEMTTNSTALVFPTGSSRQSPRRSNQGSLAPVSDGGAISNTAVAIFCFWPVRAARTDNGAEAYS